MELFKPLSNLPVNENEKRIAEKWEEIDILQKSIDSREGKELFLFYEGPPTANGEPRHPPCYIQNYQGYGADIRP